VITRDSAVLAFDLAADKQVCALTDPDSRVLARRTVRVKSDRQMMFGVCRNR
jgi:hypothetical protein